MEIFSTIALLSLALAILTASAAPTTVTIQSAEVNISESTIVPIMINDVSGVKGAHIFLEYDSSVVHASDIGNSTFGMKTYKEINNVTGYVRYAVANPAGGLTGDIKFADVTLKGISAGESPLNLTVVSLSDGAAEIPRDVVNGTFTVTEVDTIPMPPSRGGAAGGGAQSPIPTPTLTPIIIPTTTPTIVPTLTPMVTPPVTQIPVPMSAAIVPVVPWVIIIVTIVAAAIIVSVAYLVRAKKKE